MDKDFYKRLKDLSNITYTRGIPQFTDFLDLNQQTVFYEFINSKDMPPVKATLHGGLFNGNFLPERKIACFYPAEMNDLDISFPIDTLEILPLNKKFSDALNHRDFLGALMNLGIKREIIGDIITANNEAYILVINKLSDYICDNIFRVKNTSISVKINNSAIKDIEPEFEVLKGSVASERIDSIIAFICKCSRNDAFTLISSKKVFINGREISSKSHLIKPNDIISVRGYGKFIFKEILSTTKKGRYYIEIKKYI